MAASKEIQNFAFYTIPNSKESLESFKIVLAKKTQSGTSRAGKNISAMYFLDQQDLLELVTAEPGSKSFSSHIAIFVENYTTLSDSENITLSDGKKDYILPRPPAIKTVNTIPDSLVSLPLNGSIDQVTFNIKEGELLLSGWTQPLEKWRTGEQMTLRTTESFESLKLFPSERSDVSKAMGKDYQNAGFNLIVEFPQSPIKDEHSLCIYISQGGKHRPIKHISQESIAAQYNCS